MSERQSSTDAKTHLLAQFRTSSNLNDANDTIGWAFLSRVLKTLGPELYTEEGLKVVLDTLFQNRIAYLAGSVVRIKLDEFFDFLFADLDINDAVWRIEESEPAVRQVSSKCEVAVIVGTMNIIGTSCNPLEFVPARSDLEVAGGAEKWETAKEEVSQGFNGYTVAQVRGDIEAACAYIVQSANNDPSFNGVVDLVQHLDAFISNTGMGEDESIASLITAANSKLDLELDNKFNPGMGRLNPIIFALAPVGGAEGNELQLEFALRDMTVFRSQVVAFYGRPLPQHKEGEHAVVSLLMWDMLCCNAVASAPAAMRTLSSFSYMLENDTFKKVPRSKHLAAIMQPLESLRAKQPNTPIIVGCQEMPHENSELQEVLSSMTIPSDSGLVVYRQQRMDDRDASTESGFIHSGSLEMRDISDELRPALGEFLDAHGVDGKIKNTTLRKLCAGLFEFKSPTGCLVRTGSHLVVINFHFKSFKQQTEEQAEFISHALKLAEGNYRCAAYCVGDMNIEAKWAKGTTVNQQRAAVEAADAGMMPSEVRTLINAFGKKLSENNLIVQPLPGTLTTLKMRSRFQGQPSKEGELSAVQKDFVILPHEAEVEWVRIFGHLQTFACDGGEKSNLDMLQPSRRWPCDHCAVFCGVNSLDKNA